jgi:hypothetical protein
MEHFNREIDKSTIKYLFSSNYLMFSIQFGRLRAVYRRITVKAVRKCKTIRPRTNPIARMRSRDVRRFNVGRSEPRLLPTGSMSTRHIPPASHIPRAAMGLIEPIVLGQKIATEEPPNRCFNRCSPEARAKNRGFESRPSRQFQRYVGSPLKEPRVSDLHRRGSPP